MPAPTHPRLVLRVLSFQFEGEDGWFAMMEDEASGVGASTRWKAKRLAVARTLRGIANDVAAGRRVIPTAIEIVDADEP